MTEGAGSSGVRGEPAAQDDSDERRSLVQRDKARVWHPYTEMGRYRDEVDPLVVVRAEGSRLYDADGRCYLDGNSSWWTASLGHNHPRLITALAEQSRVLCHTALAGITHPPAVDLAERLCATLPDGLEYVFYSDNGSTAVEVAMKQALQYWYQNGRPERRTFVSLEKGHHGETLGVTAVGGMAVFRKPFEHALLECIHVPSPALGSLDDAIAALGQAIAANADILAGVVIEPMVQGAAGMQIYDAEYIRAARRLCDEYDTFLISDEVFAGYGRTGRMWAFEHAEHVVPDFVCSAKGFTAGMLPMGVTLTTERVFQGFIGDPSRTFHYGHTFAGNPLGAAVALAVLDVFEEEAVLEGVARKGRRIREAFARMGESTGVRRVRSIGMIGALDLTGDEGYLGAGGWQVYDEARRRGAYLRPLGNTVYICPPLNMPDDDLEELLEIVASSVAQVVG